ncbi:MAG: glycerol-3-phosphate dehydrogenase/oxidase [Crocinitomicaceae bacterium]|mgnify:FL=1|jgi:glycerol-3-phosphate dehydrogenase|tara:strand:+ start:8279 stop:9808 length:1530 start_codon:yes stop_codon:yes gene_type:complete
MNRDKNLIKLCKTDVWDLLVIGGGATGLGAALEGASRGMKVLLIDKFDFAKGTSSRSTKLVHGGVRYLRNGDFKLVRKALKERHTLKKIAPHIVRNRDFIIPIYSWLDFFIYGIGLKLYDLIAGKWSFGPTLFLNQKKTSLALPGIIQKGLKGGIQYQDGQFDDARFAISLAKTIEEQGGVCINYMEFLSLLGGANKAEGIIAKDTLNDQSFSIRSTHIINATGVFGNPILEEVKSHIKIRTSRGTHIVLDRAFLPSNTALMVPKTTDGRVLFVIPWRNHVIIGTTDIETENISFEPGKSQSDIDFLLANARDYLTKQPTLKDIKSIFSGLRPLVSTSNKNTKHLSRDHILLQSENGLLHILGGKWTTYRLMGEEAIDKILAHKPHDFSKSKTRQLRLNGYHESPNVDDPLHMYGNQNKIIESLGTNISLSQDIFLSEGMIIYAIQYEMALTLEDILARRSRVLFLNAKEAVRLAPIVVEIMGKHLQKDKKWEKEQRDFFILLASNYYL